MLDQHEKIVRAALNTKPTLDKPKANQPPIPEFANAVINRAESLLRQASCHGNFPTHVLVGLLAVCIEIDELLGPGKQEAHAKVDKQDAKKS